MNNFVYLPRRGALPRCRLIGIVLLFSTAFRLIASPPFPEKQPDASIRPDAAASPGVLPEQWQKDYFGRTGIDPNAPAKRGDGLTNFQAFEQGLDPNDFYAGLIPTLKKSRGDGQVGPPGAFVLLPLVVAIDLYLRPGPPGAPVTFKVISGGGKLQRSSNSVPADEVTVRTDFAGQAKVYFKLPEKPGATCLVTAASGDHAALDTPFTIRADQGGRDVESYGSPFNPTNVVATMNADGSGDVSWTNNADPTDLEPIDLMYRDRDGQWKVLANIPGGTSSYHIPAK